MLSVCKCSLFASGSSLQREDDSCCRFPAAASTRLHPSLKKTMLGRGSIDETKRKVQYLTLFVHCSSQTARPSPIQARGRARGRLGTKAPLCLNTPILLHILPSPTLRHVLYQGFALGGHLTMAVAVWTTGKTLGPHDAHLPGGETNNWRRLPQTGLVQQPPCARKSSSPTCASCAAGLPSANTGKPTPSGGTAAGR